MSKSQRQRPFDFGRVFFFPDKTSSIPDVIRFQPLGNHVGNVRKLVKAWKLKDFPGTDKQAQQKSKERVDEAARIHDIAKPKKFKIEVKTNKQGKFKEYIYSFKGHPYEAVSHNEWAQSLAVGHHNFSVDSITRDAYKLKKTKEYADILETDSLAYAQELYILEMCDQIEAELACRVIGDDNQAETRAFMDYTTTQLDQLNYLLDPYPFKDSSLLLSFAYWSMKLSKEDKDRLQKCLDSNQHKLGDLLDKIVKAWWKTYQVTTEKAELKTINLQPYPSKDELSNWDCETLYKKLTDNKFTPNPMQKDIFNKIPKANENSDIAILLKSPTASGKFEAVSFPALAKGYRLILPLPARSLLEDQKQRAEKYLKQFSKLHPNREFSLVVDTGDNMYRWVYRNGDLEPKSRTTNPRRHLYKGDVILTTLDKFLYRYFAYGDKQKSFIYPLRINQEKTKTLICFDEAHTYDQIAFTNFHSLIKSLYEAGRSLILMTATMPPEYTERFKYLEVVDYLNNSDNVSKLSSFYKQLKQNHLKEINFEWINEIERNPNQPELFQQRVLQTILQELQVKFAQRIIAVVQTVKDAVAIYKSLKQELSEKPGWENQELFLYHGRLDGKRREEVYTKIKELDQRSQPYILITTSAIEVGCDLNSEVLISEICLPENLIQRGGRCNRKGDLPDAKVILVGKIEGDRIPDYANRLDKAGWQRYQKTIQSLSVFDTRKIAECISCPQHIDDYRVIELFSMLHEYVYGADLTFKPTHEKGLIATRSWTPSATLVYDDGSQIELKNMPQVTVPVDRLIIKKDESLYANTHVYERYYNQEESRWELRDLDWGYAYPKDIIVKISSNHEGASMYDSKQEYLYNSELGFVELPGVFIKWKTTGFEENLQYKYDDNDKQKSVVIKYIKAL